MKIVVHMGLTKTGTTSIQTSLHAARSALAAHSVLYPDGGRGGGTTDSFPLFFDRPNVNSTS